jgi:hypothetical protein
MFLILIHRYPPTSLYSIPYWIKYDDVDEDNKLYCKNNEPSFKTIFDLNKKFMEKMNQKQNEDIPYFFYTFSTSYVHDYLTLPNGYDEYLTNMLKMFETNDYFKNTFFFIFSDHGKLFFHKKMFDQILVLDCFIKFNNLGNRLTRYSATDPGKTERKHPFMIIRPPVSFRESEYYQNMKENQKKLVTHFDTYKTLKHLEHIVKYPKILYDLNSNDVKMCRNEYFAQSDYRIRNKRGVSLFEKIPEDRTCSDALIPINYCQCNQEAVLNDELLLKRETGLDLGQLSEYVKRELNAITKHLRDQCKEFKVQKIKTIKKILYDNKKFLKVLILFQPGDAEFEAILINVNNSNHISIVGNINRISLYGKQSVCMTENKYLPYCFCK